MSDTRAEIFERLNIRTDELPAKLQFTKGINGHSRKSRFLVTGGCGYFGYELARAIHGLGGHVTLFDIQIPAKIEKHLNKSFVFIKGDICDYDAVMEACKLIDCVFHVASFGMTGKDQLNEEKTYKVNVQGTENVIKACQEAGVSKLIYTSSYNVVLGKAPIVNGDDTVPYADKEDMVDFYSKTKQDADKLILAANGTSVRGGKQLHTCCLRPAGIYGPQERRHIHRIASFIRQGIVLFRLGDAYVDWTHVNNLTQAHLLAIPALSKATGRIGAGKAYFISDGNPIKVFDFLRPVFNGLGKTVPKYGLPPALTYYLGFLMELLFWLVHPYFSFEPLLTRNEVLKMNITHFQTQHRAMKELGYRPLKYRFEDVVQLYIKENYPEYDRRYSVHDAPNKTPEASTYGQLFLSLTALLLFYVLCNCSF